MNELTKLPYIESEGKALPLPFERYLPPLAQGVIRCWLTKNIPAHAWVLEPIGASPNAILEMAESGCKVLAAVNNPVVAFELEMLANAPGQEVFQSVLGELSMQKKGTERLGAHIQNLYLTRCASCGRELPAESYYWHRAEPAPYAKVYHCTACGDEGEHAVNEFDLEILSAYVRSDPLHRARALERVPGGTREARQNLEEVLKLYSARPLYALFTLINKVEGMTLTPQRRAYLDALLLSALDAGHSLWSLEEGNDRPRVLNVPGTYIERNIWLALEASVELWSSRKHPFEIKHWPEIPEIEGICLFQGRMRDLCQQTLPFQLESMVCTTPRPSQVFWTLSTLWSSWLWGKENASNLKNVLERQRFDWYWHTNALQSALAPASKMVKQENPNFILLPEPVPGFVSAAFEACSASNLVLSGIAMKDGPQTIQTEWLTQQSGRETKKVNLYRLIREAIHECLSENGEPCRYLKLFSAVNASLVRNGAYPTAIQQITYEGITEIHGEIGKVFADRKFLRRMDATAQELESGYWWLSQPEGSQISLADRVETEIVNCLQKEHQVSADSIQNKINSRFTGFLTPSAELINQCLRSYANLEADGSTWNLRKQEFAVQRKKDLAEINDLLEKLAGKIGFSVQGENPLQWFNPEQPDYPVYRLFLSASALVTRFLKEEQQEGVESVFLFPGSRAALLHYKIQYDPYLREKVAKSWHFLKFRTLRELARRNDISRDLWDLFIDSDPISLEDATQLSMFL